MLFNGALAAGAPLIPQMAIDKNIAANILYASTRIIGEKVYGNMLLSIPKDDTTLRTAKDYLQSVADVLVEEV